MSQLIDTAHLPLDFDLDKLRDPRALRQLSEADFKRAAAQLAKIQEQDRIENQLVYYQPASPAVVNMHRSNARITGVGAGNGASKTESCLVELVTHATGVVPESLQGIGIDWSRKLRGPIQCRVICENITTVLHSIMLPKLIWNRWTGVGRQGSDKGHWGWVPRGCLKDGDWESSWSEKYRTLTVAYRNPENIGEIVGWSTIQFMSYDQDPRNMASGDMHFILLDEPPPLPVFREAQARTMRASGRILMAMTWPDDASINVDWIFDEVYERAQPGPAKNPNIDWIELSTIENRFLDQASVAEQSATWDERTRSVRIHGRPIRFSDRIHPLFTDQTETYCFACGQSVYATDEGRCERCGGNDIEPFCHVVDFEHHAAWPVVFLLDPHPRKAHMGAYVAIDPQERKLQVAEVHCDGEPADLRRMCDEIEMDMGMHVRLRLIDPRMGGSPSGVRRDRTWTDEFNAAGLHVQPADPSDVGRGLVDEMLRPDRDLRRPQMFVHPRCDVTILQFKRFMWDNWKQSLDRDQKQRPKQKYDDFPALWRYLANANLTHDGLTHGFRAIRTTRARPTSRRAALQRQWYANARAY